MGPAHAPTVVLDTNVYLDVARDAALAERVAVFVESRPEAVGLSSIVLAELLVGVTGPAERRRWLAAVAGVADGELLTPTHADWMTAGDALNQLGGEAATKGRSFWNDLLFAASCARTGATLITRNGDDFRRIGRIIPVAVVPRPT